MRVQVEVVCMPHPLDRVEAALQAAGRELTSAANSVSVLVRPTDPPTATLEFEMPRAAQYKVVDRISAIVKRHTHEFYVDITVRFLRG